MFFDRVIVIAFRVQCQIQSIVVGTMYLLLAAASSSFSQTRTMECGGSVQPGVGDRILLGNAASIELAGCSADRQYVPTLREALRRFPDKRPTRELAETIRLALARLGETDQLQQYWCAAVTELAKDGQTPLIHEFPRIGGWFAIEALRRFLTSEELVPLSRRSRKHLPGDDVIHPSPREDALKWLSAIIPSPPVKYTLETSQSEEGARQSIIWMEWIAAHKSELQTMQPPGEHVDFSDKACTRDGKPAKKR